MRTIKKPPAGAEGERWKDPPVKWFKNSYICAQQPVDGRLHFAGIETDKHAGEQRAQHRAFPSADDTATEHSDGHHDGQGDAKDVESDLDVAEHQAALVRDRPHQRLPGIHDHRRHHGQRNAKAVHGDTQENEGQPRRVGRQADPGQHRHPQVREPSKQHRQRDLQQIPEFKILAQDRDLGGDHHAIPQDEPIPHGDPRIPDKQHVRNGRNGRDPQFCALRECYAQRTDAEAEDKKQISFEQFFFGHRVIDCRWGWGTY